MSDIRINNTKENLVQLRNYTTELSNKLKTEYSRLIDIFRGLKMEQIIKKEQEALLDALWNIDMSVDRLCETVDKGVHQRLEAMEKYESIVK